MIPLPIFNYQCRVATHSLGSRVQEMLVQRCGETHAEFIKGGQNAYFMSPVNLEDNVLEVGTSHLWGKHKCCHTGQL